MTHQWEWTAKHPVATCAALCSMAAGYRLFAAEPPATLLALGEELALLALPVAHAAVAVRRGRRLSPDAGLEARRGSVMAAIVVVMAVVFLTR